MKPFIALILIAASAYLTSAIAQNDQNSVAATSAAATATATSACPSARSMEQQHLQGVWHAQFPTLPALPGQPDSLVVLRLHQHPELAGSVRGTVQRGGATAQVSGDVHEGELTLEESTDGVRISATWLGDVVEDSCAKEIHGLWNTNTPEPTTPFVLRKQATWQ